MASKVNVKFVAILAGVLVLLTIGVGVAAVSVIQKSASEYEALGDRAMEAGRYDEARSLYSKGVRKEQSNVRLLEKWVGSMEHWLPATETAYAAQYQRTYMLAQTALAQAQPESVEAQAVLLDLLVRQSELGPPSRSFADHIVEVVEKSIEPFEAMAEPPQGWQRLLRYRGIVLERLDDAAIVMTEEERQTAMEDLTAAIEADPADGRALASLVKLLSRRGSALYAAGLPDEGDAAFARAQQAADDFLARTPGEPWSELFATYVAFDRDRSRLTHGKLPDEARRITLGLLPRYEPRLDRIVDAVRSHPGPDSSQLIQMVARLETNVRPGTGLAATKGLIEDLLEVRPDDGMLMLVSAQLMDEAGAEDRAAEVYEQIASLGDVPMSLEGHLRYGLRRDAMMHHADMLLRQCGEADSLAPEEREALLARAKELRDRYAAQASAGDSRLLFLDAERALVLGDMPTAMRLFQNYNELNSNSDPRGLGGLAQASLRLGQDGVAEAALERLVALQPASVPALVELAGLKSRLQKNAAALELLRRAQALEKDNPAIAERLALLRAIENPETAEDPVVGAILASRKLRLGDETTPGDPAAAEQRLLSGLQAQGHSPLIARELIVLYLDSGRLDEARSVAVETARRHPDDESLARVVGALESGSVVEALIRLIDQSEQPPLDAALAKMNTYAAAGAQDEADRMLEEAATLAPGDPRVFEARFSRAARRGDEAAMAEMVGRAAQVDADRMGGLTYRARLLAHQSRFEEAIEVMQQAIARGAAPSAAYRLLAAQQRAAGRLNDAISTLARGLEINPDNVQTINDYIAALAAAGRTGDALAAARRSENYARADAAFVDAWLNLEVSAGGAAGRALALRHRERMLETDPANRINKIRLASLYMDDRRWTDADALITELAGGEGAALAAVQLRARWFADQGRVQVDGQFRNGIDLARSTFTDYIVALPESEVTAEPWMAMATFMADRGDLETAAAALEEARPLQDPGVMAADKVLGDLMLTRARFADAAAAYKRVVDGGADDQRQTYLQRLIETALRLNEYTEADRLLGQLREPAASSLTATLQRAEARMGRGQADAARTLLNQAVADFPSDPLPYTLRARAILVAGGFREDALADLDNALKIDPNYTRARRMRAMIYFDQGRREDALRDLREVVRQSPTLDDVGYALVQEYLAAGRVLDAVGIVEEVIEKRPQDARMMVGYGMIFAQHGAWDRAASVFQTAWDRTRNAPVAARLIDALLRQRPAQVQKATKVMADVKAQVPDAEAISGLVSLDASIAWAGGNKDRARELMAKSFDLAADNPPEVFAWNTNLPEVMRGEDPASLVKFMRGLRAGRQGAAVRWLDLLIAQRLLEEPLTLDDGVAEMARIRQERGDDLAAVVAFRSAGTALYAARRNEEARDVWTQGLEAFPDDWEMSNNVAFLLVDRLGQPEAALPYAERAVAAQPGRSSVHDTLATVQIALGRLDEAETTLNRAQALAQTSGEKADVLLTRVDLAIVQGQTDRARVILGDLSELISAFGDERERYQTQIQQRLDQIGSDQD